jgi:hypothetical protein
MIKRPDPRQRVNRIGKVDHHQAEKTPADESVEQAGEESKPEDRLEADDFEKDFDHAPSRHRPIRLALPTGDGGDDPPDASPGEIERTSEGNDKEDFLGKCQHERLERKNAGGFRLMVRFLSALLYIILLDK